LSASIQSNVAAETGDEDAACQYIDHTQLKDQADVAGNVSDGIHIASCAGTWMSLVFGFGGVRDFDGQLSIDPRLPRRFTGLAFSLRFRDRQLRVRLSHDAERYLLEEGEPLEVSIRGERHRLAVGDPLHLGGHGHGASAADVTTGPVR
jgi:alpha,alpha-trehalose phosphorylase